MESARILRAFPAPFALAAAVLLAPPSAAAANYRAATAASLKEYSGKLAAGDTLSVAAGKYDVTTWSLSGLKGTAPRPIVIIGEAGAAVRGTSECCNLLQVDDAEYVQVRGFELTKADADVEIDGVNISGRYSHHLRFEDLKVHDLGGNGFSIFPDSAAFIELIHSEIYAMGGSGCYWGYPGRNIVHDMRIEGNYIHHCPVDAQQETHYGIQFKGWGYRSRIVGNVLHDVGGTTRSGLIVYYGKKPLAGDDPADINVVAGNALWNCRNEGITVMSDALIENNIVVDAQVGINLQTYGDESFSGTNFVENLQVRNNTVFRCAGACIAIQGWGGAGSGMAFAGNAAYQPSATATAISGNPGAAFSAGNVAYGTGAFAGLAKGTGLGDFAGAAAASKFPGLDLYPGAGSPLREALDPAGGRCAAEDFNGVRRPQGSRCEAGAYEAEGAANPGWKIAPAFKPATGGGTPIRKAPGPRPARKRAGLRLRRGVLELMPAGFPAADPVRADGRREPAWPPAGKRDRDPS